MALPGVKSPLATINEGVHRAGAQRRLITASRAAAGRVCHPEAGAAVDTPGSAKSLRAVFVGWLLRKNRYDSKGNRITE